MSQWLKDLPPAKSMALAAWHAPSPGQVDQSWRSTNASWAGANFRVSIKSNWEGAMTIRSSLGRSCPATTTPQYFISLRLEEVKMSERPRKSLNLGNYCYIGCPSWAVVEVFRRTHSFPPPIQRIPTTSSAFYANNSPMPLFHLIAVESQLVCVNAWSPPNADRA